MGIPPGDYRDLTPHELFQIQEAWIEAHGGVSQRRRYDARRELDRLKRLYPDIPVEGHA